MLTPVLKSRYNVAMTSEMVAKKSTIIVQYQSENLVVIMTPAQIRGLNRDPMAGGHLTGPASVIGTLGEISKHNKKWGQTNFI